MRVQTARMVSDGGPDPAGIFSGEKEARRCWITQHRHMPPSLMADGLSSYISTRDYDAVHRTVNALQLQLIHLCRPTQQH